VTRDTNSIVPLFSYKWQLNWSLVKAKYM